MKGIDNSILISELTILPSEDYKYILMGSNREQMRMSLPNYFKWEPTATLYSSGLFTVISISC